MGRDREAHCRAPAGADGTQWQGNPQLTPVAPGFAQDPDHPVVCVSWHDAQAYVRWLQSTTGLRFRLLTSGEHTMVSLAGATTQYWWGDEVRRDVAHYEASPGLSTLTPRGTVRSDAAPANAWGFRHTSGNVAEWVEDCDGAPASLANPLAARISGACTRRVLRGGGWTYDPEHIAARVVNDSAHPHKAYVDVGFRIARDGAEQ